MDVEALVVRDGDRVEASGAWFEIGTASWSK